MIKQAVILAAGRGSRLQILARDRTKAMLPVLGKPMMVRVMDRIREAGISRFVVVFGENEGGLASYLSRSWYPNMEIKYVLQTNPNGTAEALALAAKYIEDDFLLTSVDNLPPPDFIPQLMEHFHTSNADIVLSLVPATLAQIRASADIVTDNDGWVKSIMEKPDTPSGSHAAFMLYACKNSFLKYSSHVAYSSRGEKELVSAMQDMINDGGKISKLEAEYRHHLTFDQDLYTINRSFLDEGRDASILSDTPSSVVITPPVRIDPSVSIGQNAHVGPYVYLESGSVVGENAVVRESLVLRNGVVSKDEQCHHQIVTRGTRITVKEEA